MKMGGSSAESGAILRIAGEEDEEDEEEKVKKIKIKVKWVKDEAEDEEEEEEKKKKEVEDVYFNIDNDIPLRWLMIRYCDKIGVNFHTTRFEFKGARLRETDTPLLLSFLPSDVIHAYAFQYGRSAVNYTTICIRMHKQKDTFLRVRRAAPLLPQLLRGLSDIGPQEEGSMCFVYDGTRLNQDNTADELEIEDGDIIDAFNFDESSSSLSILKQRLSLKLVHSETGKERLFTLKRSTRLNMMMNKYRELEGLGTNVAFCHEGRKLNGSKTVEEQQLEDGDEIEALICAA